MQLSYKLWLVLFLSCYDGLSVGSTHQGIYPMTIVVLVAMRLSTAELLPPPNPETFEPPISIRFSSQSFPPIAGHVGGFMESGSDVAPHEGGSTGTLACDCSEK